MTGSSPQLAIIIPTYRWNALAKDVLTQAASIGSDDIAVHIGDNSANPEKHAFLQKLASKSTNVTVTCHPTNLGADSNWLYLVKAQTAPFICMAADDDCFGGAYYRSALALIREDADCGASAGLLVSIARIPETTMPVVLPAEERRETEPLERIRNYHSHNVLCYAIARRPLIRAFADYVEKNPLQCPFNDYILAFHLLSTGTYRRDEMGYVYLFDNSHWQLNDWFIESNSRWYKGYGLPEKFGFLTRLHWAVVAVHFFSSVFRSPDLSPDRAKAIVAYLFTRQRDEFAQDFQQYKPTIEALFAGNAEAAAAFTRLMKNGYENIEAIFDDFALVVAVFSPDVARRYREFQSATLIPKSGDVKFPAPDFKLTFGSVKEAVLRLLGISAG
ncbi:MAG: glycosyltransferase [Pseudomonadota bacterium]